MRPLAEMVVHRDVSPQNIFVTREGLVKVLDFGIARAVDRVTTTASGLARGKPHSMAPAQARGQAASDGRDGLQRATVLETDFAQTRRARHSSHPALIRTRSVRCIE